MRKDRVLVCAVIALTLPALATAKVGSEVIDQENDVVWTGGGTNIVPENTVGQSFMPSCLNVTSVEAAMIIINHYGDDYLTAKIIRDGQTIASETKFIPEDDFLNLYPDGWVDWSFSPPPEVTPGETLVLQLEDTGKVTYGWKYVAESYPYGTGLFYGNALNKDFLFRTYSDKDCQNGPTPPELFGTPDNLPPPMEDVCDMTAGAAHGLCVAYCEAMDCDSDNPNANDQACANVSENFFRVTGELPPCERVCPCWEEGELENVTADNQLTDLSCYPPSPDIPVHIIQNVPGSTPGVEGGFAAANVYARVCFTRDVFNLLELTTEEAEVCVQQISDRCEAIGSPY